jgi:hypothetical protein
MSPRTITGFILAASVLTGCGGTGGTTASTVPNATTGTTSSTATGTTAGTAGAGNTAAAELDVAFLSFGHNVTVALDGNQVVLEATGRPDHTSSYWNPNNSSGLYVAPDPAVTTVSQMSPGYIENYNNLFTLRIPASPSRAARSTATSLGPVGIAVSGAPIFNDQEGPNIPGPPPITTIWNPKPSPTTTMNWWASSPMASSCMAGNAGLPVTIPQTSIIPVAIPASPSTLAPWTVTRPITTTSKTNYT